ncbi:MAG: hypothetical protein K5886_12385 [Lachnospiraceae bacterium]|nr:hypothetical protein [Lachnospiraceae bacterium]
MGKKTRRKYRKKYAVEPQGLSGTQYIQGLGALPEGDRKEASKGPSAEDESNVIRVNVPKTGEVIRVRKISRDEAGNIIPDDEELSERIINAASAGDRFRQDQNDGTEFLKKEVGSAFSKEQDLTKKDDPAERIAEDPVRKRLEEKLDKNLADEIKELENEIKDEKEKIEKEKIEKEEDFFDEEDPEFYEMPDVQAESGETEEAGVQRSTDEAGDREAPDIQDTIGEREAREIRDEIKKPEVSETQDETRMPEAPETQNETKMPEAPEIRDEMKGPEEPSDIREFNASENRNDTKEHAQVRPQERHPASTGEEPERKRSSAALVACVFIVTALMALSAGVAMALWDVGRTVGDLIKLAKGSYEAEYTQLALKKLKAGDYNDVIKITGLMDQAEDEATEADEAAKEEEGAKPESSETEAETDASGSAEFVGTELSGVNTIVGALDDDETVFIKYTESVSGNGIEAPGEEPIGTLPSDYVDPSEYYPLPFTTVDESYFADALFIGDSRLQGFGMYSGLEATYYCVTSFQLYNYKTMKVVQTPSGKVPIFDALEYDKYTKIYIKVGLNEMGGGTETFLNTYSELIDRLREYEPRAVIYVHAVLPVTAAKSSSDKTHNNPNIYALNERLKSFAIEKKAYYIDISPAVSLGDGSLMPEMTSDGIHLKAGYMDTWKEYLKNHAVVVPK